MRYPQFKAFMKGFRLVVLFSLISLISLPGCLKKENREILIYAKQFKVEGIESAVKAGANPNFIDADGKSALHWLCLYSGKNNQSVDYIISFLVEHGANIDLKDNNGNTPLFYAIEAGNYQATRTLVNLRANVNVRNNKGRSPMFKAVAFITAGPENTSNMDFVRLLFQAGAGLQVKDNEGKNLLHASLNPETTRWLIEHGLDPKERDHYGKTPLDYSKKKIFMMRDSIVRAASRGK